MSAIKVLQSNVLKLMREKGLTQVQVAARGGISQGSVSIACRGTRGQQLDVLEGIAKGLGVSVSDLLSISPKGTSAEVDRLVQIYTSLPPESQSEIIRVAQNELRYHQSVSQANE